MKKKLISLFLIIALLCTTVVFTACDDEEVAEPVIEKTDAEIINEALKKTDELNEMSGSMKMNFSMKAEGVTLEIPVNVQVKGKKLGSDDVIYWATMETSIMGQEMDMEMYQEGQWIYAIVDGEKFKVNVTDMEEFKDGYNTNASVMVVFPEELLKDAKLIKAEDGSQNVTINIPTEKFQELYDGYIESIKSEFGAAMYENLEISESTVSLTIKDDYVTEYIIDFSMNMTAMETTVTVETKTALTIDNPGQPVTITPPEGYEDFEVFGSEYI